MVPSVLCSCTPWLICCNHGNMNQAKPFEYLSPHDLARQKFVHMYTHLGQHEPWHEKSKSSCRASCLTSQCRKDSWTHVPFMFIWWSKFRAIVNQLIHFSVWIQNMTFNVGFMWYSSVALLCDSSLRFLWLASHVAKYTEPVSQTACWLEFGVGF